MEADQCIIPGCHKMRFIEGDVRHPYCSKTHADEGKRRKIFRKYILNLCVCVLVKKHAYTMMRGHLL